MKKESLKNLGYFHLLIAMLIISACSKEEPLVFKPASISITAELEKLNQIDTDVIIDYGTEQVIEHGIVWAETANPTVNDNKHVLAGIETLYSFTVTNLNVDVTYFVRGYLITAKNERIYSNEVSVTTKKPELTSVLPIQVSSHTEVTVRGRNFIIGDTKLYINGAEVGIMEVSDSTIIFQMPSRIKTDSVTVSVEIQTQKLVYPTKLRYFRGQWVRVHSPNDQMDVTFLGKIFFSNENTGYLRVVSHNDNYTEQLLKYDPLNDSWATLTTSPYDIGGTIDETKAKYGMKINNDIFMLETTGFWKFDVIENNWSRLAMHPFEWGIHNWADARGITFTYGGYGFGLGLKTSTKEMWRFNPGDSSWTRQSDFPGQALSESSAVVTSSGIIIIGGQTEGAFTSEVWIYHPEEDKWEQKSDYPGMGRIDLAVFTVAGKIYVGGGESVDDRQKDFWEYNLDTDKWIRIVDFAGPVSNRTFSFSINNHGYVGGQIRFYEMWRLDL
jgi:N-acetylneuraminic acid mutarotase